MGDVFSSARPAWCLHACVRALSVSPSGIIIIDEMTLRAGQQGLYRALAIASGDTKERTRMRYARSSQWLLTRTTAPVGASATSMNINYSDRDEMPCIPALFLTQLVARLLDCCRLRQPICKFARGLYLRLKTLSSRSSSGHVIHAYSNYLWQNLLTSKRIVIFFVSRWWY